MTLTICFWVSFENYPILMGDLNNINYRNNLYTKLHTQLNTQYYKLVSEDMWIF